MLATVTGDTQLPAEKEESKDYWLTNDDPYQYFRFEVTAIQGSEKIDVSPKISYTRWRMELSQLQIIGNNYSSDTDLDYATISGLQHYYKYTGNNITPTFTVKDMGGNTLTAGTHYTVSYTYGGNSVTTVNATGTYTLTITGTGSYTGQKTVSFMVYQALAGAGTSSDPYIIADANDWYIFGKYINEDAANVSDKYYKLADTFNNINDPITEMIATDANKPFCGTLDGNNKTLHIAIKASSDAGCAPFRYLKAATIQNLTIAGTAATSAKFGASIAVESLKNDVNGNGTEITDCYSRVTIASSIAGDGTNGGFVGINHGKLNFTRCAFLGRMLGSTAECNGGFVGWNDVNGDLNFSQCVFDPVWISMSATYSKTFSRGTSPTFNISKPSHFTYAGWGTDQGTQAVALTAAPANLGSVVSAEGTMTLYQNALLCGGKYYVTNLGLYDDASNATLLRDADGKKINVTLSGRTLFKDGNWNTLCLPFDLNSAEVGDNLGTNSDGIRLMELDTEGTYDANCNEDVNGAYKTGFDTATGNLRIYFKTASEIKAGTPYIIKWPSGTNIENHQFQSVKIDNSDAALLRQTVVSEDGKVRFIGTYSPVAIYSADHDNLYLGTSNKLHSPQTDGYNINACRAYFHVDLSIGANVRACNLYFGDDETTGIISIDNGQFLDEPSGKAERRIDNSWHDIQGRRLNGKPSTKGLYIHNGKKVVIK